MKKISLIAFMGAIVAFGANAANSDAINGDMPAPDVSGVGFVGAETFATVRDAKGMPDDTVLVLRGNIIESLGEEKYMFQDTTDIIPVEIEDETWRGTTVAPSDTVILYGQVDTNGNDVTEIDVTRLEVVQ